MTGNELDIPLRRLIVVDYNIYKMDPESMSFSVANHESCKHCLCMAAVRCGGYNMHIRQGTAPEASGRRRYREGVGK